MAAVLCLCASIPLGVRWVHGEIITRNQDFPLANLSIHTTGSLENSKIATVGGVKTGMDLLSIDLGAVKENLESLPEVLSARVDRELPDKLSITVTERVPVAWLSCPPQGVRPLSIERGFLIDENANVFRCMELRDEIQSLPVIEVRRMPKPKEGEVVKSEDISLAIQVIRESDVNLETLGFQISEVRVRSEWAMECIYQRGLKTTLSRFQIKRGIEDLTEIILGLGEKSHELATVNLAVARNIPVTFVEPVDTKVLRDSLTLPDPESADPVVSDKQNRQKHLRSILRGG